MPAEKGQWFLEIQSGANFARKQSVIITQNKVTDSALFGWLADRAWLGALVVASIVGVLLIGSVSSAATQGHRTVAHAAKAMVHARSADRHVGHHTPAVKPVRPVVTHAHRPPHHR